MGRVRVPLLALAVIVAASAVPRADVLDPVAYSLHTVHRTANGDLITTDQAAIFGVPSLLDADHNVATGLGGADLLAQLTLDLGRATLRVLKLPGAPSPFPVSVEAILRDPRTALPVPLLGEGDPDLRVAFGYDALTDGAPLVFEAALAIAGAERVTSFTMDLQTAGAAASLAVIGEVYTEGPGGARLNPVRARIGYAPVPSTAHFGVISSEDIGAEVGSGHTSIDLASDVPTTATIVMEDIQGTHQTRVTATIDKLPQTLLLAQTDVEGTGRQTFSYEASDTVASIELRMTVTNGAVIVQDTLMQITDMPTSATLSQDGDHSIFTADAPIGSLTIGSSIGIAPLLLPEPAYIYKYESGGVSSLAFRVQGLSSADVISGDPFRIQATLQPGPFLIRVVEGGAQLVAQIYDLPANITLSGSRSAGEVTFQGSSGINRVFIDVIDPAGIGGTRAKVAHLMLQGVPTTLTLSYASNSGTVTLDAHGASVGLVEIQLTSGPNEGINPAYDGLLLNDLADRYVVFARVTGLRKIVARTTPTPDLLLDSTGGRIFKIEANQLRGGKIEYIRGTLDRLVPNMHVVVTDTPSGQQVTYTADAATNSLVIDTNAGDRASLHISIGNPLPASLSICQASNGTCSSHGSANAGSIKVVASQETTVNFFDCVRPLSPTCTAAPTKFLRVDNLRISYLEQDAAIEGAIDGERGYIYVDTNNQNLSGYLLTINGGNGGFEVNLPPGFRAENRRVSWTFFGLFKNRSGTVNCPGGTSLRVRVLGFWLGVTSFLC